MCQQKAYIHNIPICSKHVYYFHHLLKYLRSLKKNKPFKTAKHLSITEEFREVDVEYMSSSLHHDVIIVSVSYAQYVCSYTVSSTG